MQYTAPCCIALHCIALCCIGMYRITIWNVVIYLSLYDNCLLLLCYIAHCGGWLDYPAILSHPVHFSTDQSTSLLQHTWQMADYCPRLYCVWLFTVRFCTVCGCLLSESVLTVGCLLSTSVLTVGAGGCRKQIPAFQVIALLLSLMHWTLYWTGQLTQIQIQTQLQIQIINTDTNTKANELILSVLHCITLYWALYCGQAYKNTDTNTDCTALYCGQNSTNTNTDENTNTDYTALHCIGHCAVSRLTWFTFIRKPIGLSSLPSSKLHNITIFPLLSVSSIQHFTFLNLKISKLHEWAMLYFASSG